MTFYPGDRVALSPKLLAMIEADGIYILPEATWLGEHDAEKDTIRIEATEIVARGGWGRTGRETRKRTMEIFMEHIFEITAKPYTFVDPE